MTTDGSRSEEKFKEVSVPEKSRDEKLHAIIREIFSKKYSKTEGKNGNAVDIIRDRTNIDAPDTCNDGGMPGLNDDCPKPE